jgi:hypothetical protein
MAEDHKRAPQGGKRAEDAKPVDWDRELPAWESSFPVDETTPAGGAEPPGPDELLVLDDLSGDLEPPAFESTGAEPGRDGAEMMDDGIVGESLLELAVRREHEAPTPAGGVPYDEVPEPTEPTLISSAPDMSPGVTPAAPTRPEDDSSSVLIIPDVAELEAAAALPRAWEISRARPAPPRTRGPFDRAPDTDRPGPSSGRDLTADGLPDLSELFSDPTPTLPLPGAPDWPIVEPPSGSDVFAEPLPEEQAPSLDLELPSRSWIWSPEALADEVADGGGGDGRASGTNSSYWRAQLAQAMDELAAVERAPEVTPGLLARRAFSVGRIAERAGSESGLAFYQRAHAADPSFLPALRGELRARVAAGGSSAGRQALLALARSAPADGAAYGELLAESMAFPESAPDPDLAVPAAPHSLAALLRAAERAAKADDGLATGRALAALAEQLTGEASSALRVVAALFLERSGRSDEAAQLRAAAGSDALVASALASVRQAAWGGAASVADAAEPPGIAPWQRLVEAADSLPPSPVRAAVLRWAARERLRATPAPDELAAETSAADLLARAQEDAGLEEGDLGEQVALATAALADSARSNGETARDTWQQVSPELTPLVLRRLFLQTDWLSADAAMALLDGARARLADEAGDGEAPRRRVPLLGILSEKLTTLGDPAARLVAIRSWGLSDPARRAAAQRRAAALLMSGPEVDLGAAAEAVAAAARAAPGEASFWTLSWQERRAAEADGAAASLRRGASAWADIGAQAATLAGALQDRAAQLDAAAHPQRLLERLPVAGFSTGDPLDDPAALVAEIRGGVTDVRKVAERWKTAAASGSAFRALEAAGWLREAGLPGEALALLLEADAHGEEHPQVALMQRRLVRLVGEPSAQAMVLGDWLAAVTDPGERAELEMLRAEALERSGAQREAASVYRELLASPLLRDADLALRRALWSLRDGPALEELWRDEHDAMSGAGRARQAAAALVEKARVARDLRADMEGAADELRAALDEDSTRQEARIMLLAMAEGRLARGAGVGRLGELARDLGSHASSLLHVAALLAQGQGPAEAELGDRLLQESVERAGGHAGKNIPLALLRRQVMTLESREPADEGRAAFFEASAASLVGDGSADPRLATALLLRAAELAEDAGDAARAEGLLDSARALEPEHLTALLRKGRLLVARDADSEVVAVLAELGRALRGPGRARALRAAAAVAAARLQDRPRAQLLLDEALTLDPSDEVAFAWLRRLLEAQGDSAGLADLLGRRAAVTTGDEAAALRLRRADLLLDPLGDRAAARAELVTMLESEPQHVGALARLATLEQQDGNLGAAAALSIRQARFERDPNALRDCFLRIGRLHTGPLEDPKLALGAYERVLRIEPFHREALEALSELYARQAETRKALAVTERLVELETDPAARLPYIIKLGTLWEAAGDARRAGVVYRRAVDELPRDLSALGELARFHERQGDISARNVLLDGSLALLREDLRRAPLDLPTLRTIIPLLRWRQRRATAMAATQLLAHFSDSDAEREEATAFLATIQARGSGGAGAGSRLAPLANPELDERALPADVQTGVRHVLRMLGPGLTRASKPDLRRYQVGRGQRQGRGTPVRELLTPLAADLGVRELDLYVSTAHPLAMAVEPGDPPAIILGAQLVEMGRSALRFAGAFLLRLVETHFALLAHGGPAEAGLLLAAVARQFLPDFRPPQLDGPALAAAEIRVSRALGKSLRAELAPFASHIAGAFSPEALYLDALETGARAGLLACGDLAIALEVIARTAGHAQATPDILRQLPLANRLSDFALSEDYEELYLALDTVS